MENVQADHLFNLKSGGENVKLHDKYSTSAAIKQVMIIEKVKDFKVIGEKCGITWLMFSAYFHGKCKFSNFDRELFEEQFDYMRGKIE